MTPSWPSIYVVDEERTMTLEAARAFGEQCRGVYSDLGYKVVEVPLGSPRASSVRGQRRPRNSKALDEAEP